MPKLPVMMDRPTFDALCKTLPATFMVVQWGESHVWKVGEAGTSGKNKVFAMSTFWGDDDADAPTHRLVIKVSPMSFEMLTQEDGIAQAPYMAKGQWVQVRDTSPLSDDDITAYIREAHRIMASKLTKKLQAELGLAEWVQNGRG